MTVLDLITRSMRLLGVLYVGATPTADQQQDGLTALNAMVDAWATRRLLMYTTGRNLYALTPGMQVYEIGPHTSAPNWIAPRPTVIDRAGLVLVASDPTQTLERELHVIRSETEFAAIRTKSLTSTEPLKLYYDRGFSNPNPTSPTQSDVGSGNIYVWPCPTVANQIALYTPVAVQQFVSLTQTVALPPGYARALPYNLAVEVAPEFDTEPSAVVVAIAGQSLADLARVNYQPRRLRADRSLDRERGGGAWDYRTGDEQ